MFVPVSFMETAMEMPRSRSLLDRMRGAAFLDVATYEDVEHDQQATGQAAVVVGIAAVASAIGTIRYGLGPSIGGIIGAFISWLIWAGVTWFIGTRLFKATATWGELLRTLGFAQAPGVLLILGIIPILGGLIRLVVAIWILIAGVIAIRSALDVDTGKAIITAVLAWLAILVVFAILASLGLGMGMGMS